MISRVRLAPVFPDLNTSGRSLALVPARSRALKVCFILFFHLSIPVSLLLLCHYSIAGLLTSAITASIPEPQREAWKKYQAKGFESKEEFEKEVVRHVETTLARSMFNCDETAAYAAASLAFRDRLITEWNRTQQRQTFADGKRVYYLSLEFLMGRALDNAMLNVGLKDVAKGMISQALQR
jgi:hypothetical protein